MRTSSKNARTHGTHARMTRKRTWKHTLARAHMPQAETARAVRTHPARVTSTEGVLRGFGRGSLRVPRGEGEASCLSVSVTSGSLRHAPRSGGSKPGGTRVHTHTHTHTHGNTNGKTGPISSRGARTHTHRPRPPPPHPPGLPGASVHTRWVREIKQRLASGARPRIT